MKTLSATELLAVWERGLERRPFERAVMLLETACPELSPDEIAGLSIGARDETLLDLRESVFGPQLTLLAACPRCSEQLESTLTRERLRSPHPQSSRDQATLEVGPYHVSFRPLTAGDLTLCAETAIDADALVRQCVSTASLDGTSISPGLLPDGVVRSIEQRMAELDPAADLRINLTCPACAYNWDESFDIVSYFWTEIDAWARRILADVHALASSYGWTERDILALSPVRRQYYLEMVHG